MITRGLGTPVSITRGYGSGIFWVVIAEIVRLTSAVARTFGLESRL